MEDVLVVTADPGHRAALVARLLAAGYAVRAAPDAAAALAAVDAAPPDAALVAANLPDLHGATLAAGLAAAHPRSWIVLLGGGVGPTPPGVATVSPRLARAFLARSRPALRRGGARRDGRAGRA